MNIHKLPNIGDKLFLMDREVVVIKVYSMFKFVRVCYAEEDKEFCIDICALSDVPDYTDSISLRLFRRNFIE